jgi:hypothetical protein
MSQFAFLQRDWAAVFEAASKAEAAVLDALRMRVARRGASPRVTYIFATVRQIAEGRAVDFLILLALYVDANRNVGSYVEQENPTIDLFLGDQKWRERWQTAQASGSSIVEFLAAEYSQRMAQIGYLPMALDDMVKIRTHQRNLPLYFLAFYSRHKQGLKFWAEVRKYASDQLTLL